MLSPTRYAAVCARATYRIGTTGAVLLHLVVRHDGGARMMKLTEIIPKNCIRVPLKATDKTAAITELVDLLNDSGQLLQRDDVLAAVLAREKVRSTGIGQGLAVPHGKSTGSRDLVMAVGKPAKAIDFDAIDARPCSFVMLLVSPVDKTGPHVKALANVSRMWLNEGFVRDVMAASTADDIFAAIARHQT